MEHTSACACVHANRFFFERVTVTCVVINDITVERVFGGVKLVSIAEEECSFTVELPADSEWDGLFTVEGTYRGGVDNATSMHVDCGSSPLIDSQLPQHTQCELEPQYYTISATEGTELTALHLRSWQEGHLLNLVYPQADIKVAATGSEVTVLSTLQRQVVKVPTPGGRRLIAKPEPGDGKPADSNQHAPAAAAKPLVSSETSSVLSPRLLSIPDLTTVVSLRLGKPPPKQAPIPPSSRRIPVPKPVLDIDGNVAANP